MADFLLSPSSINLYRQCPRRWYYRYVLGLPTLPSIHLVRGSIVHDVLERFFELDIAALDPDDYLFGLRSFVTAHLLRGWKAAEPRLRVLGLSREQLEFYLVDSQKMLSNFVTRFARKFERKRKEICDPLKAFTALTPVVEEEIRDEQLRVRGFIDAIHEGKETVIIDYKTSKRDEITDAYRLQLAIYAHLYQSRFKELPDKVGIDFLKFDVKLVDVDQVLIEEARAAVKETHQKTDSRDIKDYPVNVTPLCKWSGGQCDFYDRCIRERDQ